jgi:hypothetical protein
MDHHARCNVRCAIVERRESCSPILNTQSALQATFVQLQRQPWYAFSRYLRSCSTRTGAPGPLGLFNDLGAPEATLPEVPAGSIT